MGNKMVPKIILEGTRLTFKTELAFTLNEHPRIVGPRKYRYHSPLVSGEWCAFTNVPWGRGLINFTEDEEAQAMETYQTWVRLFELMRYYSWIVDRFHYSTYVYQSMANNRKYDFRWIEDRLLPLGFCVVFLKRSPDGFERAREERLKVSGNPGQYDNLNLYIEEQKVFEDAINNSILPVYILDMSERTVDNAAEAVADWMEERNLLYLDD